MSKRDIRVGCCGFAAARQRYFKTLSLVEVQQTFHDPPQVKTAEKWRQEAPEGFEFAVKAWQLITHPATSPTYRRLRRPLTESDKAKVGNFQVTGPVLEAWKATLAVVRALDARVVLFQCPASFKPTDANFGNMRKFFTTIERGDLRLAWEPRGKWDASTVRSLCDELRLIHCVDPFVNQPITAGTRYFRLHGIGGYRYRFTDDDLGRLRPMCPAGETCYVLFNNMTMFEDARRFLRP